jgi:hypothetical protein
MANLYELDQFQMEIHQEYNLNSASHLEYQQTQSSRQLERNTSDRGRMPHTLISTISPPTSVDWTNGYESPEAQLEYLMNEWNEIQIPFSHDWGETGTACGDLNLDMDQTDIYSPSQLCWPLGNLQSDGMFNSLPFQDPLPESYDYSTTLAASWNYPTPGLSPLSAVRDQYNNPYESDAILETSRSSAQNSQKAVYICEICSRTYPKQHLLK